MANADHTTPFSQVKLVTVRDQVDVMSDDVRDIADILEMVAGRKHDDAKNIAGFAGRKLSDLLDTIEDIKIVLADMQKAGVVA